jgi:hypothetical protein
MSSLINIRTKQKLDKKNFLPIFDVPNICTKKRAIIITIVIGKMHLFSDADVIAKPSTADRTLIAGVRAPSPRSNDGFL